MKMTSLSVVASLLLLVLSGCQVVEDIGGLSAVLGGPQDNKSLGVETIAKGLREALLVGAGKAVAKTSQQGGYANNPAIRIPLPEKLQPMARTLRKIGLGRQVDLFEQKLNAAAEEAAAQAAPVFGDAIRNMTFADAKEILYGSETAATDFMRGKTHDTLKKRYQPMVEKHLNSLGVVRLYDSLISKYEALPFASKSNFNLKEYGTDKALDGLFKVLAGEERQIRRDPVARTTALLKRVFSAKP